VALKTITLTLNTFYCTDVKNLSTFLPKEFPREILFDAFIREKVTYMYR